MRAFLFFLLAVSSGVASAATGENPLLDPLGGDWKIGYQKARGGRAIVEFVHAGESVQSWTEMATLLSMDDGKGMDLDDYVARIRAQMNKSCVKGPSIKVLGRKPVSGLPARLISVECRGFANGAQESFVQLAVSGRQALYTLQLARKVGRLDPPTTAKLAAFVGKLKICDDAVASRPCTR